jgi:hypothetical protein
VANTSANVGTPSGGQIANAVDINFGTSTAAWSAAGSAVPTHFAWKDGSGNLLDVLAVASNPGITGTGQTVKVTAGNLVITAA